MRVTISALTVVLLASPTDAFSPALSRVAKTSPAARNNDILYARRDNDDVDKRSDNTTGIVSQILLAGAALQLSTSKVSALKHDDV